MNVKAFHLSVQGSSHIKRNKICQDASDSYYDEDCAVVAVCDGHGGDDYIRSDLGAKFACAVAIKNIREFIKDTDTKDLEKSPDTILGRLEASIISGWCGSVYTHFLANPFTEEELSAVSAKARKRYTKEGTAEGRVESAYGTTLLAAAVTKDYWFGLHIGDGKFVAVSREGIFGQPVPWDENCFLNATTSICDSNALNHFRHFPYLGFQSDDFSQMRLPAAIFMGSDGIDDCFKNQEQLYQLYKTILCSFGTADFEEAQKELEEYLPRLSAKGSGDDVSIAAILDMDTIAELEFVKEFERESKTSGKEEEQREETEDIGI